MVGRWEDRKSGANGKMRVVWGWYNERRWRLVKYGWGGGGMIDSGADRDFACCLKLLSGIVICILICNRCRKRLHKKKL
jgi:hypothetical protein